MNFPSRNPPGSASSSQLLVESLKLTEYEKNHILQNQIPPCWFYYDSTQYTKYNSQDLRNNKTMMISIINKISPSIIVDLGSSTGGGMIQAINESSLDHIYLYACDYDTATGTIYQNNIDNWNLYPNNGFSHISDFNYIDGWINDIKFKDEHKGSKLWILEGGIIGNFDLQGRKETISNIIDRLDKGDSCSVGYFVSYDSNIFKDYENQQWEKYTLGAYPIEYYQSVLRQKGFGYHHTKHIHTHYNAQTNDVIVVFEVDNYELRSGLADENYTKSVRGQVAELLGDEAYLTMKSHRFTDDEILGLVDSDGVDARIITGENPFMRSLLITKK